MTMAIRMRGIRVLVALAAVGYATSCWAQQNSPCTLSEADIRELFAFHQEALRSIPDSIPGASDIRRKAPESIVGQAVECIAVGPIRVIHKTGSNTIYILDVERRSNRWEMRGVPVGATWTAAASGYLHDYLQASAKTLAVFYGRSSFSAEERRLMLQAERGDLPRSVTVYLGAGSPEIRVASESYNSENATQQNAQLLRAVTNYLRTSKPKAWIRTIDINWPKGNDNLARVRITLIMSDQLQSVALTVDVDSALVSEVR